MNSTQTAKTALISGITGQDGALLAELLLDKGYLVHGIKRRASLFNTDRIDHLYQDPHDAPTGLTLHYGDLTDSLSIVRLVQEISPDEIYNLGAQSHVAVSFESPEYTANTVGLGALRLLEAIRLSGLERKTRFYQASTSELYGKVVETPQTELTPFHPRSPYAVAKLFAHWLTVNYREAYGIYACNGILFNHESPTRGPTFVTRKITRGFTRAKVGLQEHLYLGNLDAVRDWGHARDYVEMQWRMLQQEEPEDFVIATGVTATVRDFVELVAKTLDIEIEWSGSGQDEVGMVLNPETLLNSRYQEPYPLVKVDSRYFRPTEVNFLCGDPSKAKEKLNWAPETNLCRLVKEMVESDLELARRDALARNHGFNTFDHHE